MNNKLTERKLRPRIGLTRHLIGGVLCLAAISLICARASAQNLFATDYLNIDEFTPNGVQSIFASGLNTPIALAFDSQGNLFVADQGYGYDVLHDAAVYKFTPSGLRSTVASENDQVPVIPSGLAIDGADNLFVSEYWVSGNILKFTPSGVHTIFAAGSYVTAMAFQPNAAPTDFNNDGHPDYLLSNSSTRQTGIWYLNNNVRIGTANGPTVLAGYSAVGVADFNRDGHPDYLLYNPTTGQTGIWYLNNNVRIGAANGPTLPAGYSAVGVADFNGDGHPDYLLYNPSTHQTAIWYLNNNVHIASVSGPTVLAGWSVAAP